MWIVGQQLNLLLSLRLPACSFHGLTEVAPKTNMQLGSRRVTIDRIETREELAYNFHRACGIRMYRPVTGFHMLSTLHRALKGFNNIPHREVRVHMI